MQVILKKDIPQLGRIGELVKVKEGYARNFLIPRAFAVAASSSNVKALEHNQRIVESLKKKVQKESQTYADKIRGTKIEIERRFNEAGKLFGALSAADVVEELKKKDVSVDRRDIELETIKEAGTYEIKVRLPGDVYTEIKLVLTAIEEKAAKGEKKTRAKSKTAAKPRKKNTEENSASEEEASEESEA